MPDPLKIFICYAREDRPSLESLLGHIAVFERNGAITIWYDKEITGGKDWDHEIRFNLKSADIVLLLISPEFFRSDYIHSVELTEALTRDREKEALVVPVILKKCLWHKHDQIKTLQALPVEGRPVFDKNHWPDPDDGFFDVAEGLDRILDDPDTETRRQRKTARLEQQQRAEAAEAKRRAETAARREAEKAEAKRQAEAAARQKDQPEMVPVKGGPFQMGDEHGDLWEKCRPEHTVTVADFEMGKYPVTQKLWQAVMGKNPSHFKGDDLPVESVSWDDVQDFLKKLNAKYPGQNYRLPTEAEWEYAARGGRLSKGYRYAGSDNIEDVAWHAGNAGKKTHPVGEKKANELGLHDMSGNVWEWCADWFGDYPLKNGKGPEKGSNRVIRGGSWNFDAQFCRVAYRYHYTPEFRYFNLGFRLASSPQ